MNEGFDTPPSRTRTKHAGKYSENGIMQVPVEVYARYCHKKVEKMTMTGAKKGVKKPTVEEIVQAKVRVYI